MNQFKATFLLYITVLGCHNFSIASKEKLSVETCHEIVDNFLYFAYADLYANIDDDTFLVTPVVNYKYQGTIPKSFTTEKAKSVLACIIDPVVIEQLKNSELRVKAPIEKSLVRRRGPFSFKDLLADTIDIEVNHEQGYINVRVERFAPVYLQAKKDHEARMSEKKRKLGAEYVFEWYQLDHQA